MKKELTEKEQYELMQIKTRLFKSARFCDYCGKKLKRVIRGGPDYPSLDHIIPKKRGGSNSVENLAVVCRECNGMKSDRTFPEFLNRIITLYNHLTGK